MIFVKSFISRKIFTIRTLNRVREAIKKFLIYFDKREEKKDKNKLCIWSFHEKISHSVTEYSSLLSKKGKANGNVCRAVVVQNLDLPFFDALKFSPFLFFFSLSHVHVFFFYKNVRQARNIIIHEQLFSTNYRAFYILQRFQIGYIIQSIALCRHFAGHINSLLMQTTLLAFPFSKLRYNFLIVRSYYLCDVIGMLEI